MRAHPAPFQPVISIGPLDKWGIDFVTCNPTSKNGHNYIVVAVDYFTKWAEALPTFKVDGETAALFLFNQVICRFDIPLYIVTDHGSHFQNHMMNELTSMLGFHQDHSSSYYPQANGQVEAINGVLKNMVRRLVGNHKTTWHQKLYSVLWAY